MVYPGQRAPTTSRTVGVNEKPTQWSWNMGQSCAKGQYAYGWAYHSHRRTPLAKFTSQINQDFAISVWADHAHGCTEAARNTEHNRIRDWWAGVLANSGERVETEQFVSEYEPKKECAQMSEQSQTWEDIRPTTTECYQAHGQREHTREQKANTKDNRTKIER